MKCDVCQIGEREEKRIRYTLNVGDRMIVIENTPATVCNHCGDTTFRAATVKRIWEQVFGSAAPVRTVEVPVYEYAA